MSVGASGAGCLTTETLLMSSQVSRDRRNSHWDQEEKVWGKRRLVVQQGGRILALKELS